MAARDPAGVRIHEPAADLFERVRASRRAQQSVGGGPLPQGSELGRNLVFALPFRGQRPVDEIPVEAEQQPGRGSRRQLLDRLGYPPRDLAHQPRLLERTLGRLVGAGEVRARGVQGVVL